MEFVEAKTILSKIKNGNEWFGIDYNMNLYRGCSHGCIYCDSRSNCYHIDDFDTVRSKNNALDILEKELIRKREKGVIGIGAMSDTYNPLEKKYEITRGALRLIQKHNFGVSIDTKSDLLLRDLDLLKEINYENNVIVKFTITTPYDELSSIIEPNVCTSSKRFEAVKVLNENGIFSGVMMTPVLPYITDDEESIRLLVKMAYESGAKFVYTYMGMTLRDNQRNYYYSKLDKHFPGLKNKYIEAYGCQYSCIIPQCNKLYSVFIQECRKYGLLYKMEDIIMAYKKNKKDIQISLFD